MQNLHRTITMNIKALRHDLENTYTDILIRRIAGTLPSGRVLLKERSRSAWLGSVKEMMKDYKGIGGAKIFKQNKILETAWSLTHITKPPLIFNQSNQRAKITKEDHQNGEGGL